MARPAPASHQYRGIKGIFLSPVPLPLTLVQDRPDKTDISRILRHPPITNTGLSNNSITICRQTSQHAHTSWARQAGRAARFAMNDTASHIEEIIIQPHFSGLRGKPLSVMRRDIERALIDNQGSPQEIFHNARQQRPQKPSENIPCFRGFKTELDIELRHQTDLRSSRHAPLFRADAVANIRAYMGSHLLISGGIKTPITQNLLKNTGLATLNRQNPIRQDIAGFAYQGLNLDHLMLSGFFTPKPDLYAAIHGGYIEEGFAGIGGELLYRPHTSPFSIGIDAWRTVKRLSYMGDVFKTDTDNRQFSAFINGAYDWPNRPVTFGLSLGRFLDGDIGGELGITYKPAPGWRVKGFMRYSNQRETAPSANGKGNNYTIGFRAAMPLEQLRTIPQNSYQTIDFSPFGRDKRARIHNRYALYDLTDPWSTGQLYRYWNQLTE